MTVDTHLHLGAIASMSFSGDEAVKAMNALGVDMAFGVRMIAGGGGPFGATTQNNPVNGNDYLSEVQKRHPERFLCFGMVDFFDEPVACAPGSGISLQTGYINRAAEELRRSIGSLGLRGLFIHPDFQAFPINSFAMIAPVLETLEDLQRTIKQTLPVLVHGVGNNMHYMVPEQISQVAGRYPELKFLVSQLGWYHLADGFIELMKKRENVYFEIPLSVDAFDTRRLFRELDTSRITLGSDSPWGDFGLARMMVEYLATSDQQENILGGSVERLLGMRSR